MVSWTGGTNATIFFADMAVILTVRSGDAEVPPLTLDAPRIVIGRAKSCDLRLPDPSVSPRHASLRQRGNDYLILDEASTNGTFAGNVRLPPGAPRLVRSGDLIRVGRVWLQVELQAAVAESQPAQRAAEIALCLVAGALAADGKPSHPRVVVRRGTDASTALRIEHFDKPYRIGSSADCELRLSDPSAPGQTCEVLRSGAELRLRNLANVPLDLGGRRVPAQGVASWRAGERLQCGQTTLELEDPVARTLADLEALSDERCDEPYDETFEPPAEGSKRRERRRLRATRSPQPSPASAEPSQPDPELSQASSEPSATNPAPPARRRRPAPTVGGWGITDWIVASFACVIFGVSLAALLSFFE